MAKKKRYTLEQHKELGLSLAKMQDELVHIYTQTANAYPRSVCWPLHEAMKALADFRSNMDREVFKEHPFYDGLKYVYYPRRED